MSLTPDTSTLPAVEVVGQQVKLSTSASKRGVPRGIRRILPSPSFNGPKGIAISNGTAAFVTNSAGNTVTSCTVSGRDLTSCADSGAASSFFQTPVGIAISNGVAFVVNNGDNTVTSCTVSGSTLTSCAQAASGFTKPVGIAISNGVAFVVNNGDNTVTSCTVSGSTLTSCAQAASGFNSPQYIAISSGVAFVTTSGDNNVTSFSVSGSATGDPHLLGGNGIKYDFDGEPGGTYSLFSAPQFQVTMHLVGDGPGTHFMTQIGLLFKGEEFLFGESTMTEAFRADLENRLTRVGGALLDWSSYRAKLALCPGYTVSFSQMHTTDPSLMRADGSPYNYYDVEIVAPDCHDAYDGALGQTYKCKYGRGQEKFVWSRTQEESFRIPTLFTPTGAFAVDSPCHEENSRTNDQRSLQKLSSAAIFSNLALLASTVSGTL